MLRRRLDTRIQHELFCSFSKVRKWLRDADFATCEHNMRDFSNHARAIRLFSVPWPIPVSRSGFTDSSDVRDFGGLGF